jgi:hypothetical protein
MVFTHGQISVELYFGKAFVLRSIFRVLLDGAESKGNAVMQLRVAQRDPSAALGNLLEREFDSLFFFARDEIVSLDNAGASVPAKERVVVAGWTNCFRFFKPAHCFAK